MSEDLLAAPTPTSAPGLTPEEPPPAEPVSPDARARSWAWAGVAALAALGVCLRLAYLHWVAAQPGFTWIDPDLYLAKVLAQADAEGWSRLVRAVEYRHRGRVFHLPPLYSLYLFGAGLTPWALAHAAAIGHALLFGVNVIATYAIGANLHSRRAGLVAAAIIVLAPNSLHTAPIFLQEQLYMPLLLSSFALLTWLLAGTRAPVWWALCGAVFGCAILTRSMPLYYLPLAAAGIVWTDAGRPAAWRRVAWLALGAGVVTVTYSAWLSVQVGRWIFVEDHASISMVAYTKVIRTAPPRPLEESLALVEAFVDRPAEFLGTLAHFVRSNFRPAARRWVDLYVPSLTGTTRLAVEAYARAVTDGGFVLAVLLTPFGIVLARHRQPSLILALWPPVVVLLTALSAYGGPRYRGPFESVLYVYLAVVLAGQWARVSRTEAAVAGVLSALLLVLVW
jgi:4-amino-4-deoxy-L-arabinose transferase-like glycosyltransferase